MKGPLPEPPAHEPATVLVVSGESDAEGIRNAAGAAGLASLLAPDGATALRLLPARSIDLILCEASLPDMDGTELCRAIKQARATDTIPVILMLEEDDLRGQERARAAGADDVAFKPLQRGAIAALIGARIEVRRLRRRLTELEGVVVSLSRALDDRTPVTGGQAERIAHWATQLGSAVGLGEGDLTSLYKAALLHDLGMVVVPDSILAKPGPLDEGEFSQVMQHAEAGERLLQAIPEADSVLPAVRHHHERVDGSGYPDGIRVAKGEDLGSSVARQPPQLGKEAPVVDTRISGDRAVARGHDPAGSEGLDQGPNRRRVQERLVGDADQDGLGLLGQGLEPERDGTGEAPLGMRILREQGGNPIQLPAQIERRRQHHDQRGATGLAEGVGRPAQEALTPEAFQQLGPAVAGRLPGGEQHAGDHSVGEVLSSCSRQLANRWAIRWATSCMMADRPN